MKFDINIIEMMKILQLFPRKYAKPNFVACVSVPAELAGNGQPRAPPSSPAPAQGNPPRSNQTGTSIYSVAV